MYSEEEVLQKLAETLMVDRERLTRETTAEDLATWDSMGTMKIVFMLDQAFGVALETDQASQVQSVKSILSLLHGAGKLR